MSTITSPRATSTRSPHDMDRVDPLSLWRTNFFSSPKFQTDNGIYQYIPDNLSNRVFFISDYPTSIYQIIPDWWLIYWGYTGYKYWYILVIDILVYIYIMHWNPIILGYYSKIPILVQSGIYWLDNVRTWHTWYWLIADWWLIHC